MSTASVAVEWALWGKASNDVEYRVLRCSNDALGAENFDEVLTRYTPGTLKALPQATVGWLSDKQEKNYVYFAIHDTPMRDMYDRSGREVVFTRCFCVPYAELAAGAVSYEDMYQKFRGIVAPTSGQRAEFTAQGQDTRFDALAVRVAAQLLTCKPVCIVGADQVGFAERLRFFDSVMALLPYGLRSRLSASTWVNSIYYEHKFRLSFSSASRPGIDYEVTWRGQDDRALTMDSEADRYQNWLKKNVPYRVTQLAQQNLPVEFTRNDVARNLKELYALPDRPPFLERIRYKGQLSLTGPDDQTEKLEIPDQVLQVGSAATDTLESLLIAIAHEMRTDAAQVLLSDTAHRLSEHRNEQVPEEQRHRYQQIIKEHDLLRDDGLFDGPLRTIFYDSVLQIAFGTPLTYEGYCQLEACAGIAPGRRMNRSLLLAADPAQVTDLRVRLLMLKDIGDEELKAAFGSDRKSVEALIETAASDDRMLREHARLIYHIVAWDLLERPLGLDQKVLRSILKRWGYLAPTLDRIRHEEAACQWTELRRLLRRCYDGELDQPAIQEILGSTDSAPTYDLFLAVLHMARPEDAGLVERTFTRNLVIKRGYPEDARSQFLLRLPGIGPAGVGRRNFRQKHSDRKTAEIVNGQPPQQSPGKDPDPGHDLAKATTYDDARKMLHGRQIKKAKPGGSHTQAPENRSAQFKWDIHNILIATILFVAFVVGILIVVLLLKSRP